MAPLIDFLTFGCVAGVTVYVCLLGLREWRAIRVSSRTAELEHAVMRARIRLLTLQRETEQKRSELSWNGFRKFKINIKKPETKDTCSFYLSPHDNKPLPPFLPGQYLTFQLDIPGAGKPVIRCYSLSDSPNHPDYYRVTIKRVGAPPDPPGTPPGLVSNFFHDHLQKGDILNVKAPAGHFHLDLSGQAPVVLLAGGVGLTPLLSMLNSVIESGSDREVWMFYGVRDDAELIGREHLEQLAQKHPNFHLHLCFSKPDATNSREPVCCHPERVSVELLKRVLPSNNYDFFTCAPPAMMKSLIQGLKSWGVPDKNILFEAFGADTVRKAAAPVAGTQTAPGLRVTFSRSNKVCGWTPTATSLLDFASENGVTIDSGCRAGNCGTCLTAIKSGEVSYLSEPGSKPETGSCLTCIAIPKTSLVLDA